MTRGPALAAIPLMALTLLLATSCIGGSKRLGLSFSPAPGAQLTPATVQLVVVDGRTSKNLVGPEAMNRDLFAGSQSGLIDFKVTLPTGEAISRSMLTIETAIFEAVRERLKLQGITAQTGTSGAKARVTITISDLSIDIKGSELASHVRLQAVYDRPGIDLVIRSYAEADASRRRLVGDIGGADSLSEAITLAVNRLDFSALNRFPQ
ncbi:MAG: hypothetical protein LBT40_08205 [Deltaproteobacteria bacterium]|jgi:hypothetical protein|nr:hypothetical protein [Deltaproteobacteria bacterium]